MNCADIDIITASFVPQGGEGEGHTLSAFFLPHFFFMNNIITRENVALCTFSNINGVIANCGNPPLFFPF